MLVVTGGVNMFIKIMQSFQPIIMTYLNSRRREVTVRGVFCDPIIYIGEDKFFRALSDPNQLVKSMKDGQRSRDHGRIIDFEYLPTEAVK